MPAKTPGKPIAAEKLQQLREAYDRGSLILFVGAGMSLTLGLPLQMISLERPERSEALVDFLEAVVS